VQPKYGETTNMTERHMANYIADMILQMRNLAKGAHMTTLQGLLEISYYEAYSAANKISVPVGELQHLQDIGADARRANVA
jgi:hypothetical protein